MKDKCTCGGALAWATDIDPPEWARSRQCPLHGDIKHTDPDAALEDRRAAEINQQGGRHED